MATKLYVRPELVSCPRLIERLNAGLNRKLTLLSAPAGFGKTTLVSERVASLRLAAARNESQIVHGTAWLSLDESDNDTRQSAARDRHSSGLYGGRVSLVAMASRGVR